MKLIITLITFIFLASCTTEKIETKRLVEINDYNEFMSWSLKGNGPVYKEENIKKMKIDHYIDLVNSSEAYYSDGSNLFKGVYLKTGKHQLTLILKESEQTFILRVQTAKSTFSIIEKKKV